MSILFAAKRIAMLTMLSYDDCVEGPKQATLGGILPTKPEQAAMFTTARRERGEPGRSFGPRDLFDYIYAVLHSPAYRARYADYLRSDFARIPLPGSRALFEALVPVGRNSSLSICSIPPRCRPSQDPSHPPRRQR